MFSQFRTQYPMGSIISELLQIHDGNYVVRAVVQMGGVTLATGMAAAAEIDQAEDQARVRALTVLGIHPLVDQTQAYRIVESEAETKSMSARLGPGTSNLNFENELEEPPLPDQSFSHNLPTDWSAEEMIQPPSPPAGMPNVPKRGSQNGRVGTQSSKAAPRNGPRSQPMDLSDVIAQTSVELRRLNWSNAQGRSYLEQAYGKRSRQQLTDEELLEFLHYLQAQPLADELSF